MKTFNEYFLGGLEVLYETFVERCVTEDDYITAMYDFISDFKNEQNITEAELDINNLI